MAWEISQAFNKTPSEIYDVQGAAGLCFDIAIFIFGRWVEGQLQEAESRAANAMFAASNRARAFARCMGDDMETSNVGYADPFSGGANLPGDLSDEELELSALGGWGDI